MKKRSTSILLIICMVLTLLPTAAKAAGSNTITTNPSNTTGTQNYYDSDVTWLGTATEYQKTFKAMFDSGLRKVKVGDKYGLVDKYGNWAAEPIYDNIAAHYWRWNSEMGRTCYPTGDFEYESTETIFVDGYVQAIRDGKMGLLDATGKEVIPCNYDAVGLPSEGVCRISKKVNGKTYLGYWNLELGKEIVAPDKYVIPENYEYLGSAQGDYIEKIDMEDSDEGRNPAFFDFIKGYAMVPTGKVVKVTEENQYVYHNNDAYLFYVQIIDKNGKEVLPQPYPFNITPLIGRPYPQAGPYLVYDELSTKRLRMRADSDYDVIFKSHLESGIVGQKGILVSAQYHGGIWGSSLRWYPPGAQIKLIPELSLALTLNCGYDGFREGAAKTGVINFNNKVIIPFKEYLFYDSENKVFNTSMGDFIYKPDGTKIAGTEKRALWHIGDNGYVILGDADDDGKITSIKGVVSVRTGKTYNHKNLKGDGASGVSAKDTIWVKKGNKWGLVKVDGSIILPFEYDEIYDSAWADKKNPHAIVKKDGKVGLVDISGQVLLPCSYRSIEWADDGYMNIQDDATGKYGIYNFNIKKITTPCIISGWINHSIGFRPDSRGCIDGTVNFNVGNSLNALFDMDTGKLVTGTYLFMKPLGRGLFYNTYYEKFGPDGKIVFNSDESTDTYTLVVKDGKVGSINASRLKIGGKLPTTAYVKPVPKTISPSYYLVANPDKVVYKQAEGFDITGLIVHYQDEKGVRSIVDNSKLKFYLSGKALTQGEALTTSGIKTVDVQYNGKTVADFKINIASVSASDILEDGDYYMQILGKYVYPVPGGGFLWLELSDKKPDKPFTVKLINYSEERGPMYSIEYDGRSIGQPTSKNGAQLQSAAITHAWRINKYSKFCTIRDYGNQKLIVNASGEQNANGTKVIVWSHTGSAPNHAKVVFIPAK